MIVDFDNAVDYSTEAAIQSWAESFFITTAVSSHSDFSHLCHNVSP